MRAAVAWLPIRLNFASILVGFSDIGVQEIGVQEIGVQEIGVQEIGPRGEHEMYGAFAGWLSSVVYWFEEQSIGGERNRAARTDFFV